MVIINVNQSYDKNAQRGCTYSSNADVYQGRRIRTRIASKCPGNFFYMYQVAVGTLNPFLLKTVVDELTEVIRAYVP